MLEAIALCEQVTGRELDWTYVDDNRVGDHIWYVSDLRKFKSHYPDWSLSYDTEGILKDIYQRAGSRWQ
jgi:CDP-paratose 2-epimerase